METPVYFLEGRNDHVVTAEVAVRSFDVLQDPRGEHVIWCEHSAHWPQLDEPKRFQRVIVDQLLAETRR